MAAGLVTAIFLHPLLKQGGWQDCLSLHSALETMSIIVAVLIFPVRWSDGKRNLPGNIVLLAAVSLGVVILVFSHILSY